MTRSEIDGDCCSNCGFWVQDTGDWFCEECGLPTCERCGRVDSGEELFLCPECFSKERSTQPVAYLAGAMESAGEFGAIWREEITPHLEELGYKVWNPYNEELNVGIDVKGLANLKSNDFVSYRSYCSKIVDYDLKALTKCSLVVCLLDQAVQLGAGTYGELTVCRMKRIPVFAWIKREHGEYSVPSWAMGCVTKFSTDKHDFYKMIPSAKELTKQWLLPLASVPDVH